MKRDEEFCQSALIEFLRSQGHSVVTRPGDEPPDFYITLDGTEFAVEITTLSELIPSPKTSKLQPILTAHMTLYRFVSEIETFTLQKEILNGTYLVSIDLNKPIPNFNKIKSNLIKAIEEFISETRQEESTPYFQLFRKGKVRMECKKLSGDGARITHMITHGAKWHDEICKHARLILQRAIDDKRNKLLHEPRPKMLLLLNRYLFASIKDFQEALLLCSGCEFFHSIYLVTCDGIIHQLK
ncbi:MAG: hypothetical protein ACE5WD_07410 [Candidatus Aminicenantia bacterium]